MTITATDQRRGQLALRLQEPLTAAARLKSNQTVGADAAAFRKNIKQLLTSADQEARQLGYSERTVKLAVYATIVALDELVHRSGQPMFQSWHGKPLQEEIFGDNRGGEAFFQNLHDLLTQQDSEDLADLLEVHYLCLLLGFQGRYSVGGSGELQAILSATGEKIERIRGTQVGLSPSWGLPVGEQPPALKDPWVKRIGYVAIALFLAAVLLFGMYKLSLGSRVGELIELVERTQGEP